MITPLPTFSATLGMRPNLAVARTPDGWRVRDCWTSRGVKPILLLVFSEQGELTPVKASPDQFTELPRVAVIEDKTWNHRVMVVDAPLVRNCVEMAFRMSRANR